MKVTMKDIANKLGISINAVSIALKDVYKRQTNAIDIEDCKTINNDCIACFRCIRICPVHAKSMNNNQEYQTFAESFSKKLATPRENEYFI